METTWIGCAADNYLEGRSASMKPELIVLHSVNGNLSDADMRFNSRGSNLSAHYGVSSGGEIHQYVVETDTAFHAGYVVNPTAKLVKARPGVNPNWYTVAIEHEGKPGEPLTAAQSAASAALIRDIAARWTIPLDRDHIIAHSEIRASANCPGAGVDIDALLNISVPASLKPADNVTLITLVSNVNIRSRPSVSALIVRVAPSRSAITVTGFVTGDAVNGNAIWYRDKGGNYFWAGATDQPEPQKWDQVADVDATTDTMNYEAPAINRSAFSLPARQYYQERHEKDLIVLHFTAGDDARSAFETWAGNPDHIATAYLVDVDGTIYEVFDPAQWAYHLGIKGSNGWHDKRSIGIEIANVGPLRQSAHDSTCLNWWPAKFGKKFCSIHDTGKYVKTTYRDEQYFAAFPSVQVTAVRELVSHLCQRFAIPPVLPPKAKQFMCDLEYFNNFSGVTTHANFRRDKWDIGPAFDWVTFGIKNAT